MNRNDAQQLLYEYTQKDGLRKHALAVEAAMKAYAKRFEEDEEKWGIVGLLHDFEQRLGWFADEQAKRGQVAERVACHDRLEGATGCQTMRALETAAPGHSPGREAQSSQRDDDQKRPPEAPDAVGDLAKTGQIHRVDQEHHAHNGAGDTTR